MIRAGCAEILVLFIDVGIGLKLKLQIGMKDGAVFCGNLKSKTRMGIGRVNVQNTMDLSVHQGDEREEVIQRDCLCPLSWRVRYNFDHDGYWLQRAKHCGCVQARVLG